MPHAFVYSGNSWSLGEFNGKLSYYDGMIQLMYKNGSSYNNPQHTRRSTVISFLCDLEAGMGKPEFQVHPPTHSLSSFCHEILCSMISKGSKVKG